MRAIGSTWAKWLMMILFSSIVFMNVNGCMLLAAGAAGAGAGYVAGSAADDHDHTVHEKEVIVEHHDAD